MTDRDSSYTTGGRTGGYTPESEIGQDTTPGYGTSQYGPAGQEKGSQVREKAQQQADAGLDKAASGIDSAATQLRERATQQGGKTGEIGAKVADRLESTSDYLEQHDTSEILDDIERYVRDHPMQAVGAAAFGGFVLARILR